MISKLLKIHPARFLKTGCLFLCTNFPLCMFIMPGTAILKGRALPEFGQCFNLPPQRSKDALNGKQSLSICMHGQMYQICQKEKKLLKFILHHFRSLLELSVMNSSSIKSCLFSMDMYSH